MKITSSKPNFFLIFFFRSKKGEIQNKMNERKNIKCDKKKKVSQENTYGIRQNTFNQLKDTHKKLDSKRQKKKKNKGNVLQSLKDLGILN